MDTAAIIAAVAEFGPPLAQAIVGWIEELARARDLTDDEQTVLVAARKALVAQADAQG